MAFQGEVCSVTVLLEASQRDSTDSAASQDAIGLRHTVDDNAQTCVELLKNGEDLDECWRFGILQTLDDYTSSFSRGGVALASQVFVDEPVLTGSAEVDAAFAALAEFLASRDGWPVPNWAHKTNRCVAEPWYPSVPEIFREEADRGTPAAFRSRGIRVTERSLHRA